jgi:hypothetical protein
MPQDNEVPGMHHCILGLHLEILERASQLVVCWELVEYRRHDRHSIT